MIELELIIFFNSITILDVNDNTPKIQAPKECVQVTEFHKM